MAAHHSRSKSRPSPSVAAEQRSLARSARASPGRDASSRKRSAASWSRTSTGSLMKAIRKKGPATRRYETANCPSRSTFQRFLFPTEPVGERHTRRASATSFHKFARRNRAAPYAFAAAIAALLVTATTVISTWAGRSVPRERSRKTAETLAFWSRPSGTPKEGWRANGRKRTPGNWATERLAPSLPAERDATEQGAQRTPKVISTFPYRSFPKGPDPGSVTAAPSNRGRDARQGREEEERKKEKKRKKKT